MCHLYHGENKLHINEMIMMQSALYQINTLSWNIIQVQPTETTVRGYTCGSTRILCPYSEPTSLCSYSIMLLAQLRSNKYQFYKFLVFPDWGSNPRSTTFEASMTTISPQMPLKINSKKSDSFTFKISDQRLFPVQPFTHILIYCLETFFPHERHECNCNDAHLTLDRRVVAPESNKQQQFEINRK